MVTGVPSLSWQGDTYRVGEGRMAGLGSSSSPTSGPWTTARVQREESLRGREERVDVDFPDPGLFDDELAEPDQELLEGGEVDRLAAAHALERGVDAGLLHHPPRQGRVERRQGPGPVLQHLHQLSPGAEQQHRAELRVDAAADDQLVAVGTDHRLDRHPREVFGPGP